MILKLPQQPKNGVEKGKGGLWFNTPYSLSVKTNIGAQFLNLIDTHFPKANPQK